MPLSKPVVLSCAQVPGCIAAAVCASIEPAPPIKAVAEADLVGSLWLVAVTVAVRGDPGAVYSPPVVIVPCVVVHVTPAFPVPVTDATNCCVPLTGKLTIFGLIVTTTPGEVTVMFAEADLLGSAALVAFTVTVPGVAGAVNKPFELMLPADADQITE